MRDGSIRAALFPLPAALEARVALSPEGEGKRSPKRRMPGSCDPGTRVTIARQPPLTIYVPAQRAPLWAGGTGTPLNRGHNRRVRSVVLGKGCWNVIHRCRFAQRLTGTCVNRATLMTVLTGTQYLIPRVCFVVLNSTQGIKYCVPVSTVGRASLPCPLSRPPLSEAQYAAFPLRNDDRAALSAAGA
jgi:hypothetical protein